MTFLNSNLSACACDLQALLIILRFSENLTITIGGWAILKRPQRNSEICPEAPAPKWRNLIGTQTCVPLESTRSPHTVGLWMAGNHFLCHMKESDFSLGLPSAHEGIWASESLVWSQRRPGLQGSAHLRSDSCKSR